MANYLKLASFTKGVALAAAVTGLMTASAMAETTLRVAKSHASVYAFSALDVGVEKGIFARHGLAIEAMAFGGDPKMQQGLSSGAADIGLGSGPGLSAAAKGAPVLGVAAMVDAPKQVVLVVRADGPQTLEELKGKTISVSGTGSLTDWLAHELAKKMGWTDKELSIQGLGATSTSAAALKAGQIDGMVVDLATAYAYLSSDDGKILYQFGDTVEAFHNHIIVATRKIAEERPDDVRAFLAAWFESVQYMRDHRDDAIAITAKAIGVDADVSARLYDELITEFNMTGQPNARALEIIRESQVANGTVPADTNFFDYWSTDFLPEAP